MSKGKGQPRYQVRLAGIIEPDRPPTALEMRGVQSLFEELWAKVWRDDLRAGRLAYGTADGGMLEADTAVHPTGRTAGTETRPTGGRA